MDSTAVPAGVLPRSGGFALDDPNIRVRVDMTRRILRRRTFVAGALAVVFGLSVVVAELGKTARAIAPAVPIGLLFVVFAFVLVRRAVSFRRLVHLLGRFPWQLTAGEVLRVGRQDEPAQIAVTLEGKPKLLLLSARATRRRALRVIREDGRVWLCGPDEKGRAALRVAGFTVTWRVTLSDNPPPRPATQAPRAVAGRPATRAPRAIAGSAAFLFPVLIPVGLLAFGAVLTVSGWRQDSLAAMAVGEILAVAGLLRGFAVSRALVRVSRRARLAALPELTAAARFEVHSWSPGRPLTGRVQLPGGQVLAIAVPHPGLDLVAHLQSGAPVRILGTPGGRLALSSPGAPSLTAAKPIT
ncbi:hypothetical protein GCM10017566_31080 [Amycolatopsis bartoniae]|uniref:Uncharacterized protein n=1 Tax=Amycolatopsis bartoniae TaxID=941986 RepID=A0A8H9IUQ6_9PSEU|nr:hypothetical protein GCM10017566_31080 [Amycolatopsis bartoniae]